MNRKNTVDYQELLKRYYEGKTTLEEENLLRTHFLSHTEESHADATLFRILAEESQALPPARETPDVEGLLSCHRDARR